MKKGKVTYCLRLLLILVALSWGRNVYAITYNEDHTITGSVTVEAGETMTVNGVLTITGSLTLENGSTLIVRKKSNPRENALVINGTLTAKNNVTIVVTGDMSLNGATVTIGETDNTTLIIEGDLTLANNANLTTNDACIVVKYRLISGSGDKSHITLHSSDFAVFGSGSNVNNIEFSLDNQGNAIKDHMYSEDGFSISKNKNVSTSTSSSAYVAATGAMAKNSALLPIELTSFTVSATEYGYTFNWVTASEVENDYFTLEFSIDGVDFNEIDYVHGAGTTSETSEYEYRWDDAPQIEMIYFRLKQTDYNGEYTYSDVIVSCRKKSAGATRTFRYGPLNLQVVDGELRYIENK